MSMTCPIPPKMRWEMSEDPFYARCCLWDDDCVGRVEWHHNFQYVGRRVNEKFCILPVCHYHHEIEKRRDIKARLSAIMVSRMTDADRKKYDHRKW